MAPISHIPSPSVYIDNTGFNFPSSSSAELRSADQEKDKAKGNSANFPYVYVNNRDFNFRLHDFNCRLYKPFRQPSILERFVLLVEEELYDLFLSNLTNGEELLNLAYVKKNFHKTLSKYLPQRVKNYSKRIKKNPYRVVFPRGFKSTLERDEGSRNRSLSVLYWFTRKYPSLAPVVYEKLLARSGYRITLEGKVPHRTVKITPKMLNAIISCSITVRLFTTAAIAFFKEKYEIQSDEWLQTLKKYGIAYDSFSTQPEEGPVQFSIMPIYSRWLDYPDVDTQLQNVAYLARLIYNEILNRDADYKKQAGRVFAEFLLGHPVRKQKSVFVQILAMIVAEFSRWHSVRPLLASFETVFKSTLSRDANTTDLATLWERAAVLSKKITIPYPWEPIQGIARHLDKMG